MDEYPIKEINRLLDSWKIEHERCGGGHHVSPCERCVWLERLCALSRSEFDRGYDAAVAELRRNLEEQGKIPKQPTVVPHESWAPESR